MPFRDVKHLFFFFVVVVCVCVCVFVCLFVCFGFHFLCFSSFLFFFFSSRITHET